MAVVKTDGTLRALRGRCGGVYFKTQRGKILIQAMPRHVKYAHPPAQSVGIGAYTDMSAIWMMALLGAFWAAWQLFALVHLFTDKRGEKKNITGYNWFLHFNMLFPEEIRPPMWKPPNAPYALPDFICTYQQRWIYEHTPGTWPVYCPADYYYEFMMGPEKMTYSNATHTWFLWWDAPRWILSIDVGVTPAETTFYGTGPNPVGLYHNPFQNKYANMYLGHPPD